MREKSLFQLVGIIAFELVLLYLILIHLEKIFGGLGNLLTAISPVIIGIAIAYLLNRPVEKIQKVLKIKKIVAIILVFSTLFMVVVISGNFLLPLVVKNFQDLFDFLSSSVSFDLVIFEMVNRFGSGLAVFASYIFSFTSGVLNVVFSLVVAFYFLLRKDYLLLLLNRLLRPLLGEKIYPLVTNYAIKSDRIFYRFVGAQLLDAAILGTLATVILLIIGVPYALIFGLLLGIFNMIPIFGSIIATLITVLVTFFTTGLPVAIITLIALLILQQIDANIIGPKITGDALGLKPLLIIFAIFVGSHYFGIIGMFFGVPVAAILKMLIEDVLLSLEKK